MNLLPNFNPQAVGENKMWSYKTNKGTFYIVQRQKRFHVIYNDEYLDSYSTPEKAADDLSGGHIVAPSNGVDPGELGIPDDLGDWEFTRSNAS